MSTRLPFLLVLTALAAGCGSTSTPTTTVAVPSTTTSQTPVSPAPTILTIFRTQGGTLHAAVVRAPHTTAVASSALEALGLAAPVTITDGTATVSLDKATPEEVAEIVYTLTQFSTIARVDVAGRSGLTRDDFAAYLPTIFVESPGAGATVPLTFDVTGNASVFEATFVVELVRNGNVLEQQTVTASEGAPARGTFKATLQAPSGGNATIAAFAPSAENGTPQHEVDVAVTVAP